MMSVKGVGNGFQGMAIPISLHALDEFLALMVDFGRPGCPGNHHQIAVPCRGGEVQLKASTATI
jgi:hypothetical protein